MAQWQRMTEVEQRQVVEGISAYSAELCDLLDDTSSDSSEEQDLEEMILVAAHSLVYTVPEHTKMDPNLRLRDLAALDARGWSEEYLVENFRFRRADIGIFFNELRVPHRLTVNGSRYFKLEAILGSFWLGASASQGHD
eukprot:TRINITY_DN3983_c0_g1_i2.p1 TRINITY_DN3983_c0_g1~~TRINITY_DN3983_c0_g1_i2.p1  ORF type:complete len:139 (-),score=39.42 TRINITY_DN3983_c0_g1_i2:144-560(-)